jgi:hypothetical protein
MTSVVQKLFPAPFLLIALLITCALLAACQTDGGGPTAESPRATGSWITPDTDEPMMQASRSHAPAQAAEPMTRTRAARECWMRTEKGSARENIDKRADIVNKCIDEKMKAAGGTAPRT